MVDHETAIQRVPHSVRALEHSTVPVCMHCDGDPSEHRRIWRRYTKTILFTAILEVLPFSLAAFILKAREKYAQMSIELLRNSKNLVRKGDVSTIHFPSAQALFKEAQRRGIRMEGHTYRGRPLRYYYVTFPNMTTIRFFGFPRPPATRYKGERWMDDKFLLKKKLSEGGVPTPVGGCFTNYRRARNFFSKLTKPVVVKPRRGTRGNHTTTCVYTESDLYEAFTLAKQLCHFVIVEEQIAGAVYRGTVINNRVVGILAGEPPFVVGDGIHTISQLIAQKNEKRGSLTAEVVVTPLTHQYLSRNRLTLRSVPQPGTIVYLSQKMGVRNGGTSTECTGTVHPELLKILEQAARIVDDPIIGFDFIIPDATKDPRGQRWAIIEANGSPFIHMHDDPELGTSNNVAQHIWNLWL